MNTSRKFAVWILGMGIIASATTSCDMKTANNDRQDSANNGKVKLSSEPLEPAFRHDGTLWVLNDADTTALFRTEFAKSKTEITRGMMYRSSMDQDMAMLFFMPGGDRPQSFWMKNTIVPLDIIYINSDQEVVSIQANAEPYSERSLPSGQPASYVLEIYGGEAAAQGIDIGTKVYWLDKK